MPTLQLKVVQAGVETTAGTAVAATRILDLEKGQATLKFDQELIVVERAGSLASGHAAYPGAYKASVDLKGMPLSYTDFPWFLNLFGTPCTTGTGAGADKTWTHAPSDVADVAKRVTLELGGKDTWPAEFKLAGCAGKDWGIKIDRAGLWRLDASLVGMALTKASKTAALSARTVQHVVAAGTKAYIDTATFGTTQIVGRVMQAEVSDVEAMVQDDTLDGGAADVFAPSGVSLRDNRKISAKVKLQFTASTEWDAFRAGSIQKVRLYQKGPVLGGSFWSVTLDLNGAWETYSFDDDGGLITATIGLRAVYDATLGADWKCVVVNDQTTLV